MMGNEIDVLFPIILNTPYDYFDKANTFVVNYDKELEPCLTNNRNPVALNCVPKTMCKTVVRPQNNPWSPIGQKMLEEQNSSGVDERRFHF